MQHSSAFSPDTKYDRQQTSILLFVSTLPCTVNSYLFVMWLVSDVSLLNWFSPIYRTQDHAEGSPFTTLEQVCIIDSTKGSIYSNWRIHNLFTISRSNQKQLRLCKIVNKS